MKQITMLLLLMSTIGFAQETNSEYDETLAKSLKAYEYGMKAYVFCILKTGSNTTVTKEERAKLFAGHMANINKLAAEGKLVVAGPFMKNDRNYRGIFVFNVGTIEEANALIESDPAVKAKYFEAEMTVWYSSAALQQVNELHKKVAKKKM